MTDRKRLLLSEEEALTVHRALRSRAGRHRKDREKAVARAAGRPFSRDNQFADLHATVVRRCAALLARIEGLWPSVLEEDEAPDPCLELADRLLAAWLAGDATLPPDSPRPPVRVALGDGRELVMRRFDDGNCRVAVIGGDDGVRPAPRIEHPTREGLARSIRGLLG